MTPTKRFVLLRHGIDTERGERPLIVGEAASLEKMRCEVRAALLGDVEGVYSSPLLRATETAVAVGGILPTTIEALGRYPQFPPRTKELAAARGIDTSEAFFEVAGLEAALQLGWEGGAREILLFVESLFSHSASRFLLVAHGAALEATLHRVRGHFAASEVLHKGDGFALVWDGELRFDRFLRR